MKLNSRRILALTALAGLMAFGLSARAQDATTNTPAPTAPPPATAADKNANLTRKQRMDTLFADLKTTDDQTKQIKALLKDETAKTKEARQDTDLSAKDKKTKVKGIRDDVDTQVKAMLTPEQFVKWQAFRAQRPRGQSGKPRPSTTTPSNGAQQPQ